MVGQAQLKVSARPDGVRPLHSESAGAGSSRMGPRAFEQRVARRGETNMEWAEEQREEVARQFHNVARGWRKWSDLA